MANDTLQKFGLDEADPDLIWLLASYGECKKLSAHLSESGIIEAQKVDTLGGILDNIGGGGLADRISGPLVDLVISKLLPQLLDRYGEQILQLVMNKIMEMILGKLKAARV